MNDFIMNIFHDLNPSLKKLIKISPLFHSSSLICNSGETEIFFVANLKLKSIIMSMIKVLVHLTSDLNFCFLKNKDYMCLYSIRNH